MGMIRSQTLGLAVLILTLGSQARGQQTLPPVGTPEVVGVGPEVDGAHHCLKRVYKNKRAHFQFMPGVATAYFCAWHCCPDPHGCKTILPQSYLTRLVAITIADPNFEHWQTDGMPQITQWKISKHPTCHCDCDDCDDCDHCHCHDCSPRYAIYYRCGSPQWKFYGYFCKDCPK